MLARLIATVAALLLACASPQASAYVRAERVSVSVADIANSAAPETALPAQIACKSKTAPPARASLEYPASGENAALTHWHTWGNPLSPEKPTSGNRDWLWDSAPFGDTAANEQPTAGIPNFTFNLRFPGQQYDRETGTHYNYFRDYEAGSGRYVQSDPVGLAAGINSFAYVSASPLLLFDHDGLKASGPKPANSRRGKPCPRTSNSYTGPTGVYIMFGPDSEIHKVGETGDPSVSRYGTLSRCQTQANRLNRANGLTAVTGYRCSKVPDRNKPLPLNGKPAAKCLQCGLANTFRSGGHSLPGMEPIPNPQ